MCGRYTLRNTPTVGPESQGHPWLEYWKDIQLPQARYNIAPSQQAQVVTKEGVKEVAFGVKPEWSKSSIINAKSDNLISSPYWKPKAALHPCLIPADGFYEPKGEKGTKRPWYGFELDGSEAFFMDQNFVIITKAPNLIVGENHNRMPVVLDSGQFETCELWLDTTSPLEERVKALQKPIEYACLSSFPVGDAVKDPRNEGKELFEKIGWLWNTFFSRE